MKILIFLFLIFFSFNFLFNDIFSFSFLLFDDNCTNNAFWNEIINITIYIILFNLFIGSSLFELN